MTNGIIVSIHQLGACLEKGDVLKRNYISIPLWSFPCKKWPSGLAVKVKISSVVANIKSAKYVGWLRLICKR